MMFARTSFIFAALSTFAHAQFYAPDTEFHDMAQRVFPVEAARVLAWQHNRAGAGIAEVKFDVQTTPERETVWTIRWLDAAGTSLREKTVRYPESLLVEGPKYFREVFRQLTDDDWKLAGAPAEDAPSAYWQGAELAGVARLEAVQAAGAFLLEKPKVASPADAARLAGMLVEGAMPSIANSMTLDSRLLSRGAAWLCTAEALVGAPMEAFWAPVLFLAGRDPAACALWKGLAPAPEPHTAPERFWNLQLHMPAAQEFFLFATRKENRSFAMPAMMWPHHFDVWWTMQLVGAVDKILDEAFIGRLYEYGPSVSISGGYPGGDFGAPMPGLAAAAFIATLHDFKPEPGDFTGYRAALDRIDGTNGAPGMQNLAPLLNLGVDEDGSPLIPVATVTAHDLLDYGWEQIGLQLGYAHRARERIDDTAAAQALSKFVLHHINGMEIFFPEGQNAEPLHDLRRWQFVTSSIVSTALRDHVPAWEKPADIMFRRRWLMSTGGNRELEAMIRHDSSHDECRAILTRLQSEGGPDAFQFLLAYDYDTKYPDLIDDLGLRTQLSLAVMPWGVSKRQHAVEHEFDGKYDPAGFAHALEKCVWESNAGESSRTIFQKYVEGGAREAARRFYDEVQPYLRDRGADTGILGGDRYALAWLEHDEPAMRAALADGLASYGGTHDIAVADPILRGDLKTAARVLDGLARNGDADSKAAALKAWLPLAAALRDPQHPDHTRALETFPHGDPSLLFLRWALGVQAKLPPEEAERLLSTQDDNQAKLFIAALHKDKERFEQIFPDGGRSIRYGAARVLAFDLRRQLRETPLRTDFPDLKPANAKPVGELIREALAHRK